MLERSKQSRRAEAYFEDLGTSANFAGEKTPYEFEDLDKELMKLVDFVVPGKCHTKQASTVIDCTQKPWKILRDGAVVLDF